MTNIKCPSCGSPNVEQIDVNKYQCPYCGNTFTTQPQPAPVSFQQAQPVQTQAFNSNQPDDRPGCLMNGLCFCFPLIGVILYFVKRNDLPNCAKSYLTWSLIGFGLGIFFNIVA